jgi:hypothetical protein
MMRLRSSFIASGFLWSGLLAMFEIMDGEYALLCTIILYLQRAWAFTPNLDESPFSHPIHDYTPALP